MKPKPPKSRVVDEIDHNLKKAFEDIANEPVPDRFSELLERLRSGDPTVHEGTKNDQDDK